MADCPPTSVSPSTCTSTSSNPDPELILSADELLSLPRHPIDTHAAHHTHTPARTHASDAITGAADFHVHDTQQQQHHIPSYDQLAIPVASLPSDVMDALDRRDSMSVEVRSGLPVSCAPLFRIGVFSDIQYADIDWRYNYTKTEQRWYRHALHVTQRAVDAWNTMNTLAKQQLTPETNDSSTIPTTTSLDEQKHESCDSSLPSLHIPLTCVIHFGDLIDGANSEPEQQTQHVAMDRVLAQVNKYHGKLYHLLGNHELYNHPRATWSTLLSFPSPTIAYQSFSPHPSWRICLLDSYDISLLAWPTDHPHYLQAHKLLTEKNKNQDWNAPYGTGTDRRFTRFNAGIGAAQLAWLEQELVSAENQGQRVIVGAHIPFHPKAVSDPVCLAWDYEEVLAVLHRHPCVAVCLHGHDHDGGHGVDEYGIHHHVFEAVLVCPEGRNSFGHVDVFPDRVVLNGVDLMKSYVMKFARPTDNNTNTNSARTPTSSTSEFGELAEVGSTLGKRSRGGVHDENGSSAKLSKAAAS